MIEEWRDVPGYGGLYQVSNKGKIKSLIRNKLMTNYLRDDGYYQIVLRKDGKRKRFFVHTLVASAFLKNEKNYPIVNHKDENTKNNYVSNLEWCTYKYNTNYGNAIKNRTLKQTKKVVQLDKNNNVIKVWDSARQASKSGEFKYKAISQCCNGDRKTHRGFIWKFYNEEEGVK